MKNIDEIADKYIREQYIDYGDLNDQAKIQIRDAVMFGLKQGQSLPIVSNSNNFYTRNDVIATIKDCLLATGSEIKTTMHIKKSYVEFDKDDLDNWIDKHV